ncbi:MAG: hypothetical protein ACOYI9_10985 [Candidatus Hydrogenedentales bacterium]|jgi:hypothetical protein
MTKVTMFLMVSVMAVAGFAGAQCPPCPVAVEAPVVCTTTVVAPAYYFATRPATPVVLAVPAAVPCDAEAPAEETCGAEAEACDADAACDAEAPAEEEAPAVAACDAAAPAVACAPVACRPAKLKRKMVCTRNVNVAGATVDGRPYTITKRVSCRPRSIYYWD